MEVFDRYAFAAHEEKLPAAKRRSAKGDKQALTSTSARYESVIVYVHGIGRHAAPDQLKLEWDLAAQAYAQALLHGLGVEEANQTGRAPSQGRLFR